MLLDARFQLRVVLDAARHAAQHGFGLLLGRMRVAQPFHQSFFCRGHTPSPVS
jgi:hypothetical protein